MSPIDTICALSSAWGKAAIGLIRISGPRSLELVRLLSSDGEAFEPRRAKKLLLRKKKTGEVLDEVVVTFFKGPNSYTGEDLVEIGAHGNPVILESILTELVSHETVRFAEAGEFTQRAVANSKMRLHEVESLDWILNAPVKKGVQLGLRAKLEGLGAQIKDFQERLMRFIAEIEAQLDFSEDEVGSAQLEDLRKNIQSLSDELACWLQIYESNRKLLETWTVCLAGPPNSGKSSLFNRLLGKDQAIVFDEPGTTRDFLEASMELDGLPISLIDTAGVRETDEPVEQIGVNRSLESMQRANLICWVSDQAEMPPSELKEKLADRHWCFVSSKADLAGPRLADSIAVSVKTASGLDELIRQLRELARPELQTEQGPVLTSQRQKDCVLKAREALDQAQTRLEEGYYLEWAAQAVLEAKNQLGEIIGEISSEDILQSIFKRFCIGK